MKFTKEMVDNYADELKGTTKEELSKEYFKKWAEFKSLDEMYDYGQRVLAAQVASGDPATDQRIESAKRIKNLYINARAEFDAYKRAYLLNEDPGGVHRTPIRMAAQAFAHELIPSSFLPEGVNLAKDQKFVQTMGSLMRDKGMELSETQKERMKSTMTELVSEGIGGLVGILPKLAMAGELTEAGAAFTGLRAAITKLEIGTGIDKMLAWTLKGSLEEAKTQIAGMSPWVVFCFLFCLLAQ
jgi:hypothetical protein